MRSLLLRSEQNAAPLSTPGKAGTFFGVTIGSFEGILGTLDALCLEKPSANCLSIISEFRVHLGR